MSAPLKISVAGHTNTGKTSLLRTLTRDARFGEVSARSGTTRHVEAARLLVDGKVLLELYDTPGIEESIDLLGALDDQAAEVAGSRGAREDGPTRIHRFLASELAAHRFEQEAKVLRQLLRSDAALYVIDARDPVLAKHRDELEILRMCGVPLLPLLNFVSAGTTNEAAWRDMLAGLGLHAIVRFDTVTPAQDGEQLLYTKLASLLDSHSQTLHDLLRSHQEDARQRHSSALESIATLLIETAALRMRVPATDADDLARGIARLNEDVKKREQRCVEQLLSLYRFYPDDIETAALPLVDGRWEQDLFDPYTLQAMGIKLGGGAAAGAAAGLGIDLMVGGMTLGVAAATGALLGGGLQTLRHYGSSLLGKITGEKNLRIDDTIVNALATRQVQLLTALERRGHAAQHKLAQGSLADDQAPLLFSDGQLPGQLREARSRPEWAQPGAGLLGDAGRQPAIDALAEHIHSLLVERDK